MKYKFKKILYYIFSISILAIAYANCAQQPLEKVETPVQTFEVHPKVLKSSLCSESRPVASPGSKFVFIVDMSASNFGDWRIESITSQEGQVQKLYFWDPSKASDSASDRLTAIEYFIDNCGGSTNDRYAIVAFSKTAGIAKTIKTSTQLSCEAPRFVSAAELKIQISKLKEIQNMDRLWYERWINTYKTEVTPDSLVMAGTSYPQALNCTLDLITTDLLGNNQVISDFYHVFFISDGKPSDSKDVDCNKFSSEDDKQSCFYKKSIDVVSLLRTSSLSQARDMKVYGVFYGKNEEVPDVMNGISASGGTKSALKLNSFAEDQRALCNLIVAKAYIDFQPNHFWALPLTLVNWKGKIKADSDMDGLPDDLEKSIGSGYLNPRSLVTGVLDGLCYKVGGTSECFNLKSSISCDASKQVGFGLTDCDIKILNLKSEVEHTGIDTDKDGLIDFVEIIKGLNPSIADVTDDRDGDGIKNIEEILRGTDPFAGDADALEVFQNLIETSFGPNPNSVSPQCQLQQKDINIKRLIGAPVEKISSFQDKLLMLNHDANEHKVMLLFQMNSINGSSLQTEYSYKIISYMYDKKGQMNPLQDEIEQKSFLFLGK